MKCLLVIAIVLLPTIGYTEEKTPPVFGSSGSNHHSRPVMEKERPFPVIDFSECKPGIGEFREWGRGPRSYRIVGKHEGHCNMELYSSEIEAPQSKEDLEFHCAVPVSLGKVDFKKRNSGIMKHCFQIPLREITAEEFKRANQSSQPTLPHESSGSR